MNNPLGRAWRGLLLVGGLIALSIITIESPDSQHDKLAASGVLRPGASAQGADVGSATDDVSEAGPADASADAASPAASQAASTKAASTGPGSSAKTQGQALACKAGQNGGNTDKGVTANRIRLAATNVRSGTGSSFLGTAYIGMQAVVNRVNAQGGICGRLLDLRLVDDGWNAATGAGFIANFAKDDYFALPVVPSSEGLTQAITNGTVSGNRLPVVGSDGMLKEQYGDPWVWPVATSTVSAMRIMAKHASDNGAKTFGIVFDSQYKFGIEGAKAFKDYVKQLTGSDPKAYVPVPPGKSSYAGEAQQFNDQCGSERCDFVAMLLTPETANTYINSQKEEGGRKLGFGKVLTGGAQPLFNERFARDCGRHCDGMLVWTGYNPPIGRLASQAGVAAYVDDVRSVDPGVDVNNQFLEGAYLGMKVFVHALEQVGPNLTRPALADAMNSLTYESDLASPLAWGPKVPQQRFANLSAQAFKITTASGSFVGFAEANTGFLRDPQPGTVPS